MYRRDALPILTSSGSPRGPAIDNERETMESRLPLRLPPQPAWAVDHECLTLKTREPQQFIDITDRVLSCVLASGISDGTVTVQSLHTTAAILVNEHEPLLLDDLGRVLAGWAPAEAPVLARRLRAADRQHDARRAAQRPRPRTSDGAASLGHAGRDQCGGSDRAVAADLSGRT